MDNGSHPEDWPIPPIWPEDLPLIQTLLTAEEWERLRAGLVHVLPDGPWERWDRVLPSPTEN